MFGFGELPCLLTPSNLLSLRLLHSLENLLHEGLELQVAAKKKEKKNLSLYPSPVRLALRLQNDPLAR